MQLQFLYGFTDYMALTNKMFDSGMLGRHWRSLSWTAGIGLLLAGALLAGLSGMWGWNARIAGVILSAVGGALIAIQWVIVPWQIRYYYRKQGLDDVLVEINATEEGVHTFDRGIESRMQRSTFIRADDAPGYHFLWLNKLQGIAVPDRVFEDGAARQSFRELVERQMPDRVQWLHARAPE